LKTTTVLAATALLASLFTSALAVPADARPIKPLVRTTCGGASWYALRSRTASGEMMNPSAMTAAHKTLPLGSKVKVTNLRNGKAVVVRINDRGPFIKGRLIDLSKGAAQRLDFIGAGHTRVQIEPVGGGAKSCA
jgi:rare lipoprotein A